MDITRKLHQIGIVLNQHAMEAPLEQMAGPSMFQIEAPRVRDAQPLHRGRKIGSKGTEEQMIVVGHQNVSEDLDLEAAGHFRHGAQEAGSIWILDKDIPPLVASREDMVESAFIFDAPGPSHDLLLSRFPLVCQEEFTIQDVTPF